MEEDLDNQNTKKIESISNELGEIKSLLQSILIIQGCLAGLKGEQVRELTAVSKQRVSDIWGDIKKNS